MGNKQGAVFNSLMEKYNVTPSGAAAPAANTSTSSAATGAVGSTFTSLANKYGVSIPAPGVSEPLKRIYIPTEEETAIDRYFYDYDRWYNEAVDRGISMGWDTGITANTVLDADIAGFSEREKEIRRYLEENKASLNPEYYQSVIAMLDETNGYTQQLQQDYLGVYDFYSQFDSQEGYDNYLAGQERAAQLEGVDIAATEAELERLRQELASREEAMYSRSMVDEGAAGNYDAFAQESRDFAAWQQEQLNRIAELEELLKDAKGYQGYYQGIIDRDMQTFSVMTPQEQEALRRWVSYQPGGQDFFTMTQSGVGMSTEQWAQINEPYNALVEKYGQDAVDAMAESVTRHDNAAASREIAQRYDGAFNSYSALEERYGTQALAQMVSQAVKTLGLPEESQEVYSDYYALVQKYGQDGVAQIVTELGGTAQPGGGLGDFAKARGLGVLSWFTAPVGQMHSQILGTGRFDSADTNDWGSRYIQEQQAIDREIGAKAGKAFLDAAETVAKGALFGATGGQYQYDFKPGQWYDQLSDKGKATVDTIGNLGYQIGANYVDNGIRNLIALAFGGGNTMAAEMINSGLASLSAFSSTYMQYSQNGYSVGQSLLSAGIAAATEYLTEKIGFDALMDIISKGNKSVLKGVLKAGFSELGEESLGFFITNVVDLALYGENSEFMRGLQAYKDSGMSNQEALRLQLRDKGKELAETAIVSFGSGGLSGAGATFTSQEYSDQVRRDRAVRQVQQRLVGPNVTRADARAVSEKLYEASLEYGSHAEAMRQNYAPGQDVGKYTQEFEKAYQIGKADGNQGALTDPKHFPTLLPSQAKVAYQLGRQAGNPRTARTKTEKPDALEEEFSLSDDGKTYRTDKPEQQEIQVKGFTRAGRGGTAVDVGSGESVDIQNVSFGDSDEAVVYEYIGKVATDAEQANLILEKFRGQTAVNGADFAAGLMQAYESGRIGTATKAELKDMELAGLLPVGVRTVVFSNGQTVGDHEASSKQERLRHAARQAKGARKAGAVHFDRGGRSFNQTQETALGVMEQLEKALGIEFYVFESYEKDGKRVYTDSEGKEISAPNGFYDPSDGSIHIDLNAGNDGKGTMLFTVAHELTHFIQDWSPVKFRSLARLLVDAYGKEGQSIQELIDGQKAKATANGRSLTTEEAFAEVVADSMEAMMVRGDLGWFMNQVQKKDQTLWQKMASWFKDLARKLETAINAYADYTPDSPEGRMVVQMEGALAELQKAFAEGLSDASRNYQAAEGQKNTTREGGVMMQTRNVNGNQIVWISSNILKQNPGLSEHQFIANYIANHIGDVYTIIESGQKVYIGKELPGEYTQSEYTKKILKTRGNLARAKKRAVSNLGEMIEIATNRRWEKTKHPKSKDAKYGMYRYDTRFGFPVLDHKGNEIGANIYNAKLLIRNASDGKKYLYDVVDIKKDATSSAWLTNKIASAAASAAGQKGNVSMKSIPQQKSAVNKKQTPHSDRNYLSAVEHGDMKTAQQMVDEAAKRWGAFLNNAEANEVFKQDGEVRIFYHGTNTGDFTAFDKSLLGSSSGDMGWFGKGFYFAFDAKEAGTYGSRVINAYLKMQNPYDYSQLYKFKGSNYVSDRYARFAWLYNIVKQFPEIVEGQKIYAYPNDAEDGNVVTWKQLAGWMDRIEREAQFSVEQVETPYGNIAWELRANPKQESYTNEDGETFTWTEYGMRQLFATEQEAKEPINQIGAYLSNVMGVETIPRRAIEKIDFSGAVQRAGYDGIIQSPSGDEAVVFDPNQIKSADPVTYDDDGKVIPLSERFDTRKADIRYSDRDPTAKATQAELEKQNEKLREDVVRLRELVKLQGKETGGTVFKPDSIFAAGQYLAQYANAKLDSKERKNLNTMLKDFYTFLATESDYSWEDVQEKAKPIAQYLQQRVNLKPQLSDYARDVLREIRSRKIALDDTQKAEVAYRYGSYEAFRRSAFGSVTFSNDGTAMDTVWQEMAGMFPGTFDEDISAADMPGALMDIIDSMRNSDTSQLEYAYNREMILADLTRAVYDSYWRVSNLRTVADRYAGKIRELRSKHREQMEDLRSRKDEAVQNLREKRKEDMERIRTLKEEIRDVKDRQKEIREGRNKTTMRNRIQKVVNELNRLLLNGDKEHHVPEGLRKAVAEILDAINMDPTSKEERKFAADYKFNLNQYDKRILRETDEKKRKLLEAERDAYKNKFKPRMEAYLAKSGRFKAKLDGLKAAYDEIKNETDPILVNAYSDGLSAYLQTLIVEVGDTPLRDMSLQQLETVYEVCRIVTESIRNANRSFTNARNGTIREQGKRTAGEVRAAGGIHDDRVGMLDPVRKFLWNNFKPVYAMARIGSRTFMEAFEQVRNGEDVWAMDIVEARQFFLETAEKHGYNGWDMKETKTFHTPSGIEFRLNLEQMMSIYAYSKRKDAQDHLRLGGIVFDSNDEVYSTGKRGLLARKINTANAYQIGANTLQELMEALTAEQIAFVDDMQRYLSDTMGAKGNEVSMAMYGVKLFRDKNYFPLKSARQYLQELEQPAGEVKLKNSGFTKKTKPGANNPMVLGNFMDVWSKHVNDMSLYHGFTLPLEDFNRIFNYQTPKSEEAAPVSVKASIQGAYSPAAVQYISQMLTDVNGGARNDPAAGVINRGLSLFKKGAVFASASVVIQQPSAIARAAALIDVKYFAGKRIDPQKHAELWAEAKQYAPVTVIKEMGFFDTSVGKSTQDYITGRAYHGLREQAKALVTDSNFRDEVLSKAPAFADEVAWAGIWNAVKREQADLHKDMDTRSEEFLTMCGKRFTDVIVRTQVYDSVLSRSGNMRSKDTGMKMATAFMAEPTTSINMLADALIQGKRGKKTYARRTVGSVIAAQILNAILVSLVYAGRDDDEDKTYLEKYLKSLSNNIWNDVFLLVPSSIPFIRDVVSLAQGYEVERSDMSVVSDIMDAFKKLGRDNLTPWQKVEAVTGSVCQLFGLPVKNILRDVRAVFNTWNTVTSGERTTARGALYAAREGVTGKGTSNAQQLYNARVKGDEAHIQRIAARYETEESADAAVRTVIKDRFLSGEIDEWNASRELLLYGGLDASEAHWTVDKWVYTRDTGSDDGYSRYGKLFDAALAGEDIETYIQEFTGNGYDRDDVTANLKKQIGKWYYLDTSETRITRADAQKMLEQYLDMNAGEIEEQLLKWDMRMNTGFSYESMKEKFLAQEITEEQAMEYLQTYGGMDKYDARERVNDWLFEEEWGFSYSDIRQTFYDEEITRAEAIMVLVNDMGLLETEAEKRVQTWQCYMDTGIEYNDIQSLYVGKEITAERAIELRMEYGGYGQDEARGEVLKWQMELDHGIKWEELEDAFLSERVTEEQAIDYLMQYGDYDEEKAGIHTQAWAWRHENQQYRDLSDSQINKYLKYCEPVNISKEDFYRIVLFANDAEYDYNADGGTITNSKNKKIIAEIDKLPLSDAQKDALAYAMRMAASTVRRLRTW